MEVETMKLSNTLGRQMKPIFEEIANNLIPAINQAFANNSEGMGNWTTKVVLLVAAVSDLIGKDWPGLLENLDKLGKSKFLSEPGTEEAIQKGLGGASEYESTVGRVVDIGKSMKEDTWKWANPGFSGGEMGKLLFSMIIDTVQYALGTNNDIERKLISSEGIPRG